MKNNQYKIIDNFLNNKNFSEIRKIFYSVYFPWYLNNTIDNSKDYQLTHLFYKEKINSDFYNYLIPLINKINPLKILRIKANLLWKSDKIKYHGFHTDYPINILNNNFYTAVYYINTNNGHTKFKNGNIVKSIKNRIVIFNTFMEHTGSTCTDKDMRIVININYLK